MFAIRRILYPTDFSDLSKPAFEVACAMARDYGAELVVLHVSPWPVVGVVEGITIDLPTGWEEEVRARLGNVSPADPAVRVVHRLERGEASAKILNVAAETKADLIVMGTHGRTGLSRLLIGSVAEDVLRKASCPVLTVNAPFPAGHPAKPEPASHSQPVGCCGA
jgi:nucleotide-binding universal stress UspA family protein